MPGNARTALRALRVHRLRSSLTMLGIVIGVAAVVVMVSIGLGARERIAEQIRTLGTNLITISPGSARMGSVQLGRGAAPRLREEDALAIESEIPGIVAAAPVLYARAQLSVGSSNWQGVLRGVTPEYFVVREWPVVDGRDMTAEDQRRAANVVLLGSIMRDRLFREEDPIGSIVRIRGAPFSVIGGLKPKGQSVWGDSQDDLALVPLKTARRYFVGTSRANPTLVHNITVKFAEGVSAEDIMAEIHRLLWQRHSLRAGQEDSFIISNLSEAAEIEGATTQVVSVLLLAVASVSMVVGGIGIMNIMLVTVTERTREIGLRMAVGARRRDILMQFLFEAVLLCVLGGGVGALLGIGAAIGVGFALGWPVIIDLTSVMMAVGFAALVGIIFGYHPARRAASLQPITALRTA